MRRGKRSVEGAGRGADVKPGSHLDAQAKHDGELRSSNSKEARAAAVRQRCSKKEFALEAAQAAVQIKLEREAQLIAAVQSKADEAVALRRQLVELTESLECPVCLERTAAYAFACGHCYCCHDECGSASATMCPSCNTPVTSRTKLFGLVSAMGSCIPSAHAGPVASAALERAEEERTALKEQTARIIALEREVASLCALEAAGRELAAGLKVQVSVLEAALNSQHRTEGAEKVVQNKLQEHLPVLHAAQKTCQEQLTSTQAKLATEREEKERCAQQLALYTEMNRELTAKHGKAQVEMAQCRKQAAAAEEALERTQKQEKGWKWSLWGR